jgi:hypothetical protein
MIFLAWDPYSVFQVVAEIEAPNSLVAYELLVQQQGPRQAARLELGDANQLEDARIAVMERNARRTYARIGI